MTFNIAKELVESIEAPFACLEIIRGLSGRTRVVDWRVARMLTRLEEGLST